MGKIEELLYQCIKKTSQEEWSSSN
nr:unnamed protein product [Callosobruchus analis]CAI5866749.1 unnamed protein product [Callosobruchus analis]